MKKYMIAKYIRLSMEDLDLCNSEEKAESVSISNQRNFIDTFIEQGEEFQGAEIKEFVDDGYSGTNFDRPAIKELLRSCRQGEIDCIIVKDDCVIIEPTQKDLENQGFVAGSICF